MMLLAGLMAPSVAPLVDHHFAERQPAHQHLGVPYGHVHTYGGGHVHDYAGPGLDDADGNGTAFYKSEAGPAGAIVLTTDKAMRDSLLFEPASTFKLPASSDTMARQAIIPPPDKPPRSRL